MAHDKRLAKAYESFDPAKLYPLAEAVRMVKGNATAKFDETVELSMNLGIDPRHADQMVRGGIVLPHGTGKSVRILVFAKGEKEKEAQAAGADFVGGDDLARLVERGAGGAAPAVHGVDDRPAGRRGLAVDVPHRRRVRVVQAGARAEVVARFASVVRRGRRSRQPRRAAAPAAGMAGTRAGVSVSRPGGARRVCLRRP